MPGLGVEPAEPEDPEDPEDPDVPGDPDRPDDGERTGLAGGDTDGPAADPDADPEADPDAADPEADPDVADALGWVGELVASWVQAAMITRSLAGSALPPSPLRSTK